MFVCNPIISSQRLYQAGVGAGGPKIEEVD